MGARTTGAAVLGGVLLVAAAGCGGPGARATVHGCTGTGDAVAPEVVVTASDNGRRMCLPLHGTVRISLPDAGAGRPGAPVGLSGTALSTVSDHLFRGVSPGTAVLTSEVPACPGSPAPGTVECLALTGWRVTVDVR